MFFLGFKGVFLGFEGCAGLHEQNGRRYFLTGQSLRAPFTNSTTFRWEENLCECLSVSGGSGGGRM